ncbi:MAG: hypothetical protein KJ804_05160 [Proteobacteria bacterium]|nr:hypothetical protein [Pseudomonadota bacterium]MBU1057693.1 hypothetical protein [Pseudomonadota bacterium]
MKKYIFVIIAIFVFTGCATIEPPVINTEGNTYYSSKTPSIHIELPLEFEYLGTIEKDFRAQQLNYSEHSTKAKNTINIYGSITNNNYMKKLIVISVLKLSSGKRWSPETLINHRKLLKSNIVKLGDRNFQYDIKARKTTGILVAQYLLDKGITTPKCNMRMVFGRVFRDNIKMYISYYEDVSNYNDFSVYSCEGWFEKEMLNDKQKEYLKEFEIRAHDSIKVQ